LFDDPLAPPEHPNAQRTSFIVLSSIEHRRQVSVSFFRYTVVMLRLYAGTSGWAYPSWKPDFYPAKLSSAKFLAYYAGRLNSVELNYTFRRMPTPKLLAGWVAATPADFKFAVKAHQTITHVKRLRDVAEWTAQFISSLEPLAH